MMVLPSPATSARRHSISPCLPRHSRAWAIFYQRMNSPGPSKVNWIALDLRPSREFISGLIARSPIFLTPRFLIAPFSGYFTNPNSRRNAKGLGSYVELVVSASKSLVQKSREEILEIALRELAEFFPIVKEAKVLKAAVIKEVYATYSVSPGLDQFRPGFNFAMAACFPGR